jgi:RNA polymerase sigma-70 factor (ECF subfamily)
MADYESAELLARWRAGDQQAATELVDRFTERLLALVRGQMSEKLARRIDAEDVLQSAYRTFFAGARDDRYVLRRPGDLWRLLSAIAVHKVQHQVEHHTAEKRSIDQETSFGGESGLSDIPPEVFAREPSPLEAAALVDELDWLLRDLKPLHRQMVEMRLQGHALQDIAAATDRSDRLVRRVLDQVKGRLQERVGGHASS